MSASGVDTKANEAVALMEAGDWTGAANKLRAARALLAAIPDAVSQGDEYRWDRKVLDDMIRDCERQQAASLGVQRQKIEFVRPTT